MKQKKKWIPVLIIVAIALAAAATAQAGGFRWNDHTAPFTFLFGNHIDTHQETQLKGSGELQGFFYIVFQDKDGDGITDTTPDGIPIAAHCTEKLDDYSTCQVGWLIRAKPCIQEVNGCTAMFLYHKHDHPVWLIGPHMRTVNMGMPNEETFLDGDRTMIPQEGSPGHFHWLTDGADHMGTWMPSSIQDIEALFGVDIDVPAACNVAMAKELTTGTICPGYYLEIQAIDTFAFKHGGMPIPVEPGTDLSTHLNFVTSYVEVTVPTTGLP